MAVIYLLKVFLIPCCILSLSVLSHPMWRYRTQKSDVNALQSAELQDLNNVQCAGKKSSTERTLLRPPTRRKGFLSRCATNISCVNPQTVPTKQNKIKMSSALNKSPVKYWNLLDSPVYSTDLKTKVLPKDPPQKMEINEEEWYYRTHHPETSATLAFFTPCLCKLSGVLSNAEIPDKYKAELSATLETRWDPKRDTSTMEKSVIELVYDMAKKKVLGMEIADVISTSKGSMCAILDRFSLTSDSAANNNFQNIIENLESVWNNIEYKRNLEQMPSHGGWYEEWNKAGQVIVNCFNRLISSCLAPGEFYNQTIEHEILLLGQRLGNTSILQFFYNLTKDLMIQPKDSRLAYYEKTREKFLEGLQSEKDVRKSTEKLLTRTYALQKDLRKMLQGFDDEHPIFPIGIHAPIEFLEEEDNNPEVHASTFRKLRFRSISMPSNLRNSPFSSS